MQKIYGLVAFGYIRGLDAEVRIHSAELFVSPGAADAAKETFLRKCQALPKGPLVPERINRIERFEYTLDPDAPRYSRKFDGIGDLMPVQEFLEACKEGDLVDYDGFGHPARDGMVDMETTISPDDLDDLPSDATHVVWYNR